MISPLGWTAVLIACLVAGLTPFALRPALRRMGVIDNPNHRSSHSRPTIRGGGVAQLLAILIGGLFATVSLVGVENYWIPMSIILVGAICTGLVGLAEDVKGLSQSTRAGLQIIVGVILATALTLVFEESWWWLPFAALFFAAYVNFANFMDGINGISSIHGLVGGIAYASFGWVLGEPWLILIGLIVGVSFVAFFPWNMIPPGMFLGDVGSYLLGAALAAIAMTSYYAGISPVAVISPLVIYLADSLFTLIRRATRGDPIFEAHRSHVYQRLTNTGLSHLQASGVVGLFTIAASASGFGVVSGYISWGVALLLIILLCAAYVLLPRLLGDIERTDAGTDILAVDLPASTTLRSDWVPSRWAVIGGSGFIGGALADHLASSGIHVERVKAPRVELDPKTADGREVSDRAASMKQTDALAAELTGFQVVVNAAGAALPDGGSTPGLYGANSLLPVIVAWAAQRAGVQRVIHLSSAAVQGDRPLLDDSPDIAPFSPYSRSKALGERAFFAATRDAAFSDAELIVIRATSVQGRGRQTTKSLQRIAGSMLASVASPGDQPSVVSSLEGLVTFVQEVGSSISPQRPIQLQPWEGLSTADVLQLAGGKRPMVLPAWLCRTGVQTGKMMSSIHPRMSGLVRRVEVMWFGQGQKHSNSSRVDPSWLAHALIGDSNE